MLGIYAVQPIRNRNNRFLPSPTAARTFFRCHFFLSYPINLSRKIPISIQDNWYLVPLLYSRISPYTMWQQHIPPYISLIPLHALFSIPLRRSPFPRAVYIHFIHIVVGGITQEWKDELLTWDPSDFGGLKIIRMPCERIWLPDIVLYNKWTILYYSNVHKFCEQMFTLCGHCSELVSMLQKINSKKTCYS